MKTPFALTLLVVAFSALLAHGTPPGLEGAERSPLSTFFIAPTRVVWQSEAGVQNAGSLLKPHAGQAVLKEPQPPCVLTATLQRARPASCWTSAGSCTATSN